MSNSTRNPAQTAARASLIAPLLVIGLSVLMRAADVEGPERRIVAIAQGVIALVVLLIGVGAAVYALVASRRYGREGVIGRAVTGLCLNGGMLALGLFAMGLAMNLAGNRSQVNQGLAELDRQVERLHELNREQIESGEMRPEAVERIQDMAKVMEETASKGTQREAASMQAMASVLRDAAAHMQTYQSAFDAFNAAGGIDAATLKTLEQIDERLKLLAALDEANEKLDVFHDEAPAELRKKMIDAKVSSDEVIKVHGGFMKTYPLELLKGIRQTDRTICAEAKTMLTTLHDQWGRWRVEGEELLIDDDAAMTTYNRAFESLMAAADKQHQLQQEVLARQEAARRGKGGR